MKTIKKHVFLILIVLFFLHLTFRIFSFLPEYTIPFDPAYWEDRYNKSQWVVSNSPYPIGDDGLYAYAGWEYIHGVDPTLLNAEIPPLPKYIIGAGEVVFRNQNILVALIGFACLFVFYLLNLKVFQSKLFALIPVFIFSFDPLFYSQLRAPYLDTIFLLFLLLTLYFALSKKYFLMSFFLGCFASTKFPAGSLFLALPLFAWVFMFDKKGMKMFLISLTLWPLVFFASYGMYFYHGGDILGFLGVQKWIIHFYATGVSSVPGIIFPIIFNGTWYTWFSGIQKISEWTILWPISFLFSAFAAFVIIKKLLNLKGKSRMTEISLLLFWCISYLLFLTATPVFPRYLLLLLPFMYNLSVWYLTKRS